ncbi:hypothetical protein [Crossiella sp. CA198]|uniref:hypothetical protein n=1 Tax=Crossiella sp. CA198 TaxID=3455607 RepID=UPI003F8D1226
MFVALLMTLYAGIVPLADGAAQSTDTYSTHVAAPDRDTTLDITFPSPSRPGPKPTDERDADITFPSPAQSGAKSTDADITFPAPPAHTNDIVFPGKV